MLVYEASLSYKLVSLGDPVECSTPQAVVSYLATAVADNPIQESFFVIPMDRKNRPLFWLRLSLGGTTATFVPIPVLFKTLLLSSCTAFVVAHNHPSGHPAPSAADLAATRDIREAAKLLSLTFIDHVIIGLPVADPLHLGYFSFRAAGLL